MPPSPRYTVRLPSPLDARVQTRVQAGTPFAVLIREALSAYLADTPPTGALTPAGIPPTPADTVRELQVNVAALTTRVEILEQRLASLPMGALTAADSADSLHDLQHELIEVTTRVKVIEEIVTRWPALVDRPADSDAGTHADLVPTGDDRSADTGADSAPTDADTGADVTPSGADTAQARPPIGHRKLTAREARALRTKRARGISIAALMREYGLSRATLYRYLQD